MPSNSTRKVASTAKPTRAVAAKSPAQKAQAARQQKAQAAKRQQQAAQAAKQQAVARQQQLGLTPTQGLVPGAGAAAAGLVSPYDGTSAVPGLTTLGQSGSLLPGQAASPPQVNATNQTALATNGDVNQHVTNENEYVNKYYNVIMPGGYGSPYGAGWGSSVGMGQTFIDPQTGVVYMKQEGGVTGWIKRLLRGY